MSTWASFLLLALHVAPSSGAADSTTAQCEPWCQNTEQHVKYCSTPLSPCGPSHLRF